MAVIKNLKPVAALEMLLLWQCCLIFYFYTLAVGYFTNICKRDFYKKLKAEFYKVTSRTCFIHLQVAPENWTIVKPAASPYAILHHKFFWWMTNTTVAPHKEHIKLHKCTRNRLKVTHLVEENREISIMLFLCRIIASPFTSLLASLLQVFFSFPMLTKMEQKWLRELFHFSFN
jgi:hypothetical protein